MGLFRKKKLRTAADFLNEMNELLRDSHGFVDYCKSEIPKLKKSIGIMEACIRGHEKNTKFIKEFLPRLKKHIEDGDIK